jgi:hypothetical protein
MKSVVEYIQEKMVFTKDNYKAPRELSTKGVDTTEISKTISYQTPAKDKAHYDKMEAYKKKGSDPKRLAKSIKDKTKLISRWHVAILIDWIDCAVVFRDEIINRGYATEDELDIFILSKYNNPMGYKYKDARESIEEYLDEIGVKHD